MYTEEHMVATTKAEPSHMKRLLEKKFRIWRMLVIALVGISLYLPTIKYEFTNWDDTYYITQNPRLRLPLGQALADFFVPWLTRDEGFPEYQPLRDLSLWVDFQLYGNHADGFHLHNAVLHGLNGALVCGTLAALGTPAAATFLASLLFVIHPVHVESVAWVSSRKDLLGLFFFLLTIWTFVVGRRRWAIMLLCCALLSKSQTVVLPLIISTWLWWKGEPWRRNLKHTWPMYAIVAVYTLQFLFLQFSVTPIDNYYERGYDPHPIAMISSYGLYMNSLVLPFNLSPYYDLNDELKSPLGLPFLLGCSYVILTLALLKIAWRRRLEPLYLGLCFGCIGLIPVINILPHPIWIADRYMYFVALFMLWPASIGLIALSRWRWYGAVVPAFFVCMFTALTMQQIPVWENSTTLWQSVLRQYPTSFVAHINYGVELRRQGKLAAAEPHIAAVVRQLPNEAEPRIILISNFAEQGNFGKAWLHWHILNRNSQPGADTHRLAGFIAKLQSGPQAALPHLDRAVRRNPSDPLNFFERAVLYKELGRHDEAEKDLMSCLTLDARLVRCLHSLGNLYAKHRGEFERANDYLKRAHAIAPDHPETLYDLGVLALRQDNDPEHARRLFEKALESKPNYLAAQQALEILKSE